MACNPSNDVIDGFTSFDVVDSQGMGAVDTAEFKVCFPFDHDTFRDIYLAKQSDRWRVSFHAPANRAPKQDNWTRNDGNGPSNCLAVPDQCRLYTKYCCWSIACKVSYDVVWPNERRLTRNLSHRIYHEAHYQLRKQNIFYFTNFGSDLKTLTSNVGLFKCRSGACGHGRLRSELANVVFELGDEELPNHAEDRVHAFGCVIRHLRSEIIIGSLHLKLAYHTFGTSAQLSVFASTLSKIKVQDQLTITGDEMFLEMSFGDLPKSLGMDVMPIRSSFQAYHPEVQYSPGWFNYQYRPQKYLNKDAESQDQHRVAESSELSEAADAAVHDLQDGGAADEGLGL